MDLKRARFSKDSLDVVTVKVGDKLTPCSLHRVLLCAHSKYFENAFTGSFKEARDREIKLEEVGLEIFVSFMNWQSRSTSIICWTCTSLAIAMTALRFVKEYFANCRLHS
ncbi:hypothetical protein NA57DRAFT_71658 [Rhizodiscina lignyota]|uniref:BTB domain-containing protein n=1 Tax=Rhizodiscina lignyota TaxID=1504668 RepID=A0A9P4M9Z3_9PEZI|nr:hypothetical protein NA57DRAFT_71658 [Rhizodiscina lignyota]